MLIPNILNSDGPTLGPFTNWSPCSGYISLPIEILGHLVTLYRLSEQAGRILESEG